MVKTILYTKNPVNSSSIQSIVNYAEENNVYYRCLVNEESPLYDVKEGTHILTTKGNDLYVLETSFREDAFDFAKYSSITTPVLIEHVNF